MSGFSYDRYDTRRSRYTTTSSRSSSRSTLGYWIPLAITVTAATAGIVAWVWRERADNDDDLSYGEDSEDHSDDTRTSRRLERERRSLQEKRRYESNTTEFSSSQGPPPSFREDLRPGEVGLAAGGEFAEGGVELRDEEARQNEEQGFMARMSGAIRRTPSPQKWFDGARQSVAAGVAAVGKGLESITEGDERTEGFNEQGAWNEQAELKTVSSSRSKEVSAGVGRSKIAKRMVCVVVSAEDHSHQGDLNDSTFQVEHASILSHLIGHANSDATDIIILIHAPSLQSHPLSSATKASVRRGSSQDDSFEQVEVNDSDTEEANLISQWSSAADSSSALYTALTRQANSLVEHPTHVLPFTTPNGHIHLLRHLSPSLVYMQDSLTGHNGEIVKQIEGWVGQTVVLIGTEGAGLVDTETEDEGARKEEAKAGKWWQDETRVGLGKGVEVVDVLRVGEDWDKRVGRN